MNYLLAGKRRTALLLALVLLVGILPLMVYAAPTTADDAYTIDEGGTLTVDAASGVLANDTCVGTCTVNTTPTNDVTNGTLTLAADGSFEYVHDDSETTSDTFTYEVTDDDDSQTDTAVVTITITLVNDNDPVLATNGGLAINENDSAFITNNELETTDADTDAVLTYTVTAGPSNGTLFWDDGSGAVETSTFTQADLNVGFVYYMHDGTDVATTAQDTFDFSVSDGGANPVTGQTFTIDITGVDDSPVAGDDSYATPIDAVLTVNAPGVLANDSDEEGQPLSAAVDTLPTNGTLTGDAIGTDGSFEYTPNTGFSGVDMFTYTVTDGTSTPSTGTVVIGVAGDIPQDLAVAGETVVPVLPAFSWVGVDGATAYQLYLQEASTGRVLWEEYPVGDICMNVACEVDAATYGLPAWGLVDGSYEWWVGANTASGTVWSGGTAFDAATFTVDIADTLLPANIAVNPGDGRVAVYFDDDPNTLWVNLWMGPAATNYYQWLSRDTLGLGSATQDDFSCDGTTCVAYPTWDVPTATGLSAWMQAWGPGGFSSGGTAEPLAPSWNQMSATVDAAGATTAATTFSLPADPPTAPTNIDVTDPAAADVEVIWTGSAGSTWYNMVIYNPASTTVVHNGWHVATASNCWGALVNPADYDCAVGEMGLTLVSGVTYQIYMQTWGPGGFSTGGTAVQDLPAWNVGEFTYSYTPA